MREYEKKIETLRLKNQEPPFCDLLLSNTGREDDIVLCAFPGPPPLIFPSQPLFAAAPDLDRGLFVTSDITGGSVPPDFVALRGDICPAGGRAACPRTGVNPDRTFWITLRIRGVVAFSELRMGMLSAVKTCGGTLSQSSKSSGALRFLPIDEEEAWNASCSGWGWGHEFCGEGGRGLFSGGVRGRKTGCCTGASTVIGLDTTDAERARELEATLLKSGISRRGGAGGADVDVGATKVGTWVDARGLAEEDAVGRGLPLGVESLLFAADNLSCRILTLRVRVSIFEFSFFFSLRSLLFTFSIPS